MMANAGELSILAVDGIEAHAGQKTADQKLSLDGPPLLRQPRRASR